MNIKVKFQNELRIKDIQALDFTMIKLKLQDQEEGLGWSEAQCNEAEKEYIRFLILKRAYPDQDLVPHKAIDLFWHQHILDTEKYATDCQEIFGFFLHHDPYFGIKNEQDKEDLINAFENTKNLYKRHFGELYVGMAKKCKGHNCRTQCKPQKCK